MYIICIQNVNVIFVVINFDGWMDGRVAVATANVEATVC